MRILSYLLALDRSDPVLATVNPDSERPVSLFVGDIDRGVQMVLSVDQARDMAKKLADAAARARKERSESDA